MSTDYEAFQKEYAEAVAKVLPFVKLSKLKVLRSLSQETHCFTAELTYHGTKYGQVQNHGHGGPDEYATMEGRQLADRLASGHNFPEILDCAIAEAINAHELERYVKRFVSSERRRFKKDTSIASFLIVVVDGVDLFSVPIRVAESREEVLARGPGYPDDAVITEHAIERS